MIIGAVRVPSLKSSTVPRPHPDSAAAAAAEEAAAHGNHMCIAPEYPLGYTETEPMKLSNFILGLIIGAIFSSTVISTLLFLIEKTN